MNFKQGKKLALILGALFFSNLSFGQGYGFSNINDKTGWTNVTLRANTIAAGKFKVDDKEIFKSNTGNLLGTETANVSLKIKIPVMLEIGAAHFFDDNWAMHASLSLPNQYKASGDGISIDVFKITQLAFTVQHHFNYEGNAEFKPYVGAGFNYAKYSDFLWCEDLEKGDVCNFDKSNVGAVIQGGFNYDLGNGLSLNVEAKMPFNKFAYKYKVATIWDHNDKPIQWEKDEDTLKFSPLIIGVGIGYMF